MEQLSVLKFGGSSMAVPELAASIFLNDPERNQLAVVSAIGKPPLGDSTGEKVTDHLILLEAAVDNKDSVAIADEQEAIIELTRATYQSLDKSTLNNICDRGYALLNPLKRTDGFKWVGEHMSAQLFAALTGADYLPTGLRFSGSVLQLNESMREIQQSVCTSLKRGRQVVTEGYFGYDLITGKIATLPRGGSDISGIVYSGALNAGFAGKHINENYTDKDGILSADPDIVSDALVIPQITYEEAREKMHGIKERNGVVHGDAIAYAATLGVEMVVRNTLNPNAIGTRISAQRTTEIGDNPIIGISGKRGVRAISIFDLGMADATNYLASILQKVGDRRMSVANLPTAEDRLKLTFNGGATDENLEAIRAFVKDNAISGNLATVEVAKDQGSVYIIGQELKNPLLYTKTIGRVANVLAAAGLSMKEVISHEKSPSLALTVDGTAVANVIKILHDDLITSNSVAQGW